MKTVGIIRFTRVNNICMLRELLKIYLRYLKQVMYTYRNI